MVGRVYATFVYCGVFYNWLVVGLLLFCVCGLLLLRSWWLDCGGFVVLLRFADFVWLVDFGLLLLSFRF